MHNTTLFINTKNFFITQFQNYQFDQVDSGIGIDSYGIYSLFDGVLDEGEFIDSQFELGPTDFGIPNHKRIRAIDIGGKCTGSFQVTVKGEFGDSYTKTATTNTSMYIPEKFRIFGNRSVRSRYFIFTFENVDGSVFEIDDVKVFFVYKHGTVE